MSRKLAVFIYYCLLPFALCFLSCIIAAVMLRFLLKAFRRASPTDQSQQHCAIQEPEHEAPFDPMNPFPDPVILEFRDVIDLHSIPPKQARRVVEGYLEEARANGVRFVRIIHGKGIGVQREMVRAVLARTPFVIEYKDAPAEAGGWGATIVTLDDQNQQP